MADESNEPMKLTQVKSEAQAALIVGVLADQGIEAQTEGGLIAGFRAEALVRHPSTSAISTARLSSLRFEAKRGR